MHIPFPRLPMVLAALLTTVALAGCQDSQVGPVVVSVIGAQKDLVEPLKNSLSPPSKLILEATAQGLVAFDESGGIVPALAQRWIVEDEGRSYIFRLRRARWPDGSRIDAKEVAELLKSRIRANLSLDPLGDLDVVAEVVPMTGEVIEVRLAAARPTFLQLLAQPQMAILSRDGGTGPYRKEKRGAAWFLKPVEDPMAVHDGDTPPEVPSWQNRVLRAERAAKAIARFRFGLSQLVLGGRFTDLPLLAKSGVDKNAVHVDPVQGLFGLAITGDGTFLDDQSVREALSMAIEREKLPAAFALGGWGITDAILPQQLDLPGQPSTPRWHDMAMDDRRSAAADAITRWRTAHGTPPVLRIALPEGAGAKVMFGLIASDLGRIGVAARQVRLDEDADLRLIDEVAAYDSAVWYLGRISCARKVHCDPAAEAKLNEVGLATAEDARIASLGEAEALVTAHAGYIPLAAPVRWSLAARLLNGFTSSPRARHPLNHLFRATN